MGSSLVPKDLQYAADREQQAFEGWGTSLCWFANVAGGYPDPQRNYLADLLFDLKKGLGLQICRYNIGGSGWGTLDVPNFRYGANIERCAARFLTCKPVPGLSLIMYLLIFPG